MEERSAQRLDRTVGVIGLGGWQLGADWGEVERGRRPGGARRRRRRRRHLPRHRRRLRRRPQRAAHRAVPARPPGRAASPSPPRWAAASSRRPQTYTLDNFRAWTDRSRANLGVDTLDLVQLHCPPTAVYSADEVFDALDTLVAEQRIAAYGVSVETCDEALTAIARPGVASVQIILNMLRLRPLDGCCRPPPRPGSAIIARVPLASGLLSGRYDERHHVRRGRPPHLQPPRRGLRRRRDLLRRRLRHRPAGRAPARPARAATGATMAQFALRWILDQPGVSVVIPGARNPEQARRNAAAAALAPLADASCAAVPRRSTTS